MNVKLVQVESKQALCFSNTEKPVWFIHGLTVSRTRYVYKKLFGSEIAADIAVVRMTDVNGEVVAQMFSQWDRTYQWSNL